MSILSIDEEKFLKSCWVKGRNQGLRDGRAGLTVCPYERDSFTCLGWGDGFQLAISETEGHIPPDAFLDIYSLEDVDDGCMFKVGQVVDVFESLFKGITEQLTIISIDGFNIITSDGDKWPLNGLKVFQVGSGINFFESKSYLVAID